MRWLGILGVAIPALCQVGICTGAGMALPLAATADVIPPDVPANVVLQKVEYHIERQLLASALTRFAEQSNLQILFRTQGVPVIEVGPLHGVYEPQEALALLLKAPGLGYTFGNTRAVVIHQLQEKSTNLEKNVFDSNDVSAESHAKTVLPSLPWRRSGLPGFAAVSGAT